MREHRLGLPLAVTGFALLAVALPAHAGLFDKLGEAAGDAAARATGRTVEKSLDKATTAKPEPPREVPAPKEERSQKAASNGAGGGEEGDTEATSEAKPATPAAYSNRYDFVPGDKVLLYDDFSEDDVGEHPARWTFKDGGGGRPVEVVQIGKQRFVKCRQEGDEGGSSLLWLRYAVKEDMPKKFTIELDADIDGPFSVVFSKPHQWGGQEVVLNQHSEGKATTHEVHAKLPDVHGVQHVAIAVSGTQVKLYVAGERVLVDPDGVTRPITRLGIEFYEPAKGGKHQMFTNFRVAEGGKDAKTLLASGGRIVTHGILFDTGSDVLRPESGPTLRSIQSLLQEDPGLRFRIEGHTDDQGSAAVNGPLSEKRAQAVKAWLAKEGVAGKRLETKGFGSTKPIDSAGTQEARANNRRVEFVKL